LGKKYGISNVFTGLMKSWSFNVGEGSFKEGNYGEDE